MGFICTFDNKHYSGVRPVLAPVEFRRVEYRYFSEFVDRKTKNTERTFEYASNGFEIAKEVNIAACNFDQFKETYVPKFGPTRVVEVIIKKKPVERVERKFDEEE